MTDMYPFSPYISNNNKPVTREYTEVSNELRVHTMPKWPQHMSY